MPKVLHVGCGQQTLSNRPYFSGWEEVRLDIDARVKPDIVASITDLSAVEAASFDAVYSSHNLEHLYAHEVPRALSEFRRVLNGSGFAVVMVPDLQVAAKLIAEGKADEAAYISPSGPISALDIVYGYSQAIPSAPSMAHRTGFTRASLKRALRPFFESIAIGTHLRFNLAAVGFVRSTGKEIEALQSIMSHS